MERASCFQNFVKLCRPSEIAMPAGLSNRPRSAVPNLPDRHGPMPGVRKGRFYLGALVEAASEKKITHRFVRFAKMHFHCNFDALDCNCGVATFRHTSKLIP
jgi:hypothetical protein